MIHRKFAVFGIVLFVIFAAYGSVYLMLRMNKTLVHRFTTGNGNEIVIGDYNPGVFLLDADPEASAAGRYHYHSVVRFVFSPIRFVESLYHDLFYRYPGLTSH